MSKKLNDLFLVVLLSSFIGIKLFAKKNTYLDLNDEKDDGTAMVLEDSENYIVPPEEDEDQTDDQATDSDKPEDLEDLKHLGTIYVNRNPKDYSYNSQEISVSSVSDDNYKNMSLYTDKEYYYEDSDTKDEKNEVAQSSNKPSSSFKSLKEMKGSEIRNEYHYNENSPLTNLNNNIEERDKDWMHYYIKEKPGNKWYKRNQILLIVVICLSALIILSATISTVLLIKLKLNHRKQNKRRLNDKLIDYDEISESSEVYS